MIRLRVFRLNLNIHLTIGLIFLILLQFGWGAQGAIVAFVAIVLSVFIHELGHAVVAADAGARVGGITLHAFGGFTTWSGKVSWVQKMMISLAGSAVQVVLGAIVYTAGALGWLGETVALILDNPLSPDFGLAILLGDVFALFVAMFVWASVFWGLINLLPVGGLDGSHILAELLERWLPGRGRTHAAVIGLIVAVVLGVILWSRGFGILPFLFVFYAVRDLMALRK